MAFINALLLPDTLSAWHGGPRFATQIQPSPSGDEARRATWTLERGAWELEARDLEPAEFEALMATWLITAGRAHGFRYHDQDDDTGTNIFLGTGDGITTTFQLAKHYEEYGLTYTRPITRFVSGTVQIWVGGVPTTAFLAYQGTGMIAIDPAPGVGVAVTASFTFHVPVRFDMEAMEAVAVEANTTVWSGIRIVEIREAV